LQDPEVVYILVIYFFIKFLVDKNVNGSSLPNDNNKLQNLKCSYSLNDTIFKTFVFI